MKRRHPRKQAKVLSDDQLESFLDFVSYGKHGLRDRAILLLSYKSGLRAAEIASLRWSDLLDARGVLRRDYFRIVGKGGRERKIPLHPQLFKCLYELVRFTREKVPTKDIYRYSVAYAARGGAMSANNVTVHVWNLYRAAGFQGASSHSGRRTMITSLARNANIHKCSIKDVQLLAGHARLETTQLYVEPSENIADLVKSL